MSRNEQRKAEKEYKNKADGRENAAVNWEDGYREAGKARGKTTDRATDRETEHAADRETK